MTLCVCVCVNPDTLPTQSDGLKAARHKQTLCTLDVPLQTEERAEDTELSGSTSKALITQTLFLEESSRDLTQ